jgi:hypothetical protein
LGFHSQIEGLVIRLYDTVHEAKGLNPKGAAIKRRRTGDALAEAAEALSCRHCERSEAIHSFFLAALWIASLRSQ